MRSRSPKTLSVSSNPKKAARARRKPTTRPSAPKQASLRPNSARRLPSQTIKYTEGSESAVAPRTAEEALRESEMRYRGIFEGVEDAVFVETMEGGIVDVNQRACEMFGYSREVFLTKTVSDLVPSQQEVVRIDAKTRSGPGIRQVETINIRANGEKFPVEISGRVWKFRNQQLFLIILRDITERKKAYDALQTAEEKYRAIFSGSIEGIFQSTPEGRFLTANPALASMWGYASPEDLIASIGNIAEQVYTDPGRRKEFAGLMEADGQVYGFEYQVRRKDGRTMWVSENARAVRDARGKLAYYEGQIEDITTRKLAGEELKLFRTLIDQSNDAIEVINPETGRFQDVNEKACLDLGYTRDEYLSREVFEVDPTIDRRSFRGAVEQLRKSRVLRRDGIHRRKDGSTFPVEVSMKYVRLDRDWIVNVARDITERKRAEATLRESEEKFRLLAESALTGIYLIQDGLFRYVNRALASIFGYEVDELIDHLGPLDLTHPEDRSMVTENVRMRVEGEVESIRYDFRGLRKDGSIIYVEAHGRRILHSGKPGVIGTLLDVTARKQAEEAQRTTEEKYRSIFENAIEAITQTTPDGKFLTANPAAARILGYGSPRELIEALTDIHRQFYVDPARREEFIHVMEVQGAVTEFESEVFRRDGSTIWISENSRSICDPQGKLLYYEGTTEEITGRKRAEEKIHRQLERLTALKNIDQIITSNFDLNVSLEMLLTQAMNQLKVDAADVLVLNPTLNTLEFRAGHGFRTVGVEKGRVRLGEGYAGRVALDRKKLHISDLRAGGGGASFTSFLAFEGFVSYDCVPLIAKGHVKGVMEVFHRSTLHSDTEWFDFLETLAQQAAIAIDNIELFENLQRSNSELILAYDATIEGWSRAMDLREKDGEGHTFRVTEVSVQLAKKLGITGDRLIRVRWGALLHDIGNMAIPDEILQKADKLTESDWQIVREHPKLAYDLLAPIHYLRSALDIPYCHHERWDGTGYPRGLKAEQVPLEARLFSVVDVWDALTSDRPYRRAWSAEEARSYILESAGSLFDPAVVRAFLEGDWTEALPPLS